MNHRHEGAVILLNSEVIDFTIKLQRPKDKVKKMRKCLKG
jgi:hypothetical protein